MENKPKRAPILAPYTPPVRKKTVPIRQRKDFVKLENELIKVMDFWKHISARRMLYTPAEEAEILSAISFTAYQAMRYVRERLKPKTEPTPTEETPEN